MTFREEKSESRVAKIYSLKHPVFNKKIKMYAKKQQDVTHTEKESSPQKRSRCLQMLNSGDKNKPAGKAAL